MKRKLGVLALVFMLVFGSMLNIGLITAAEGGVSVGATWRATDEAAATMTVESKGERGQGRFSYTSIPATPIIREEPSQNAVIADVTGYTAAHSLLSIKYETNIELGTVLIFVHHGAGTKNGVSMAAGITLIAFFNGWNTAGLTSKDGTNYRTIKDFQSQYIGDCVVNAIQISMESSVTGETLPSEHYFEVFGVEFHAAGTTPVFVTDPPDPVASTFTNVSGTHYTISNVQGGTQVSYNGASTNAVKTNITNWTPVYRSLILGVTGRVGMKLAVQATDGTTTLTLADHNLANSIFTSTAKTTLYFTIPDEIATLTGIILRFDPSDDLTYTPNTGATTAIVAPIAFETSFALRDPLVPAAFNPSFDNGKINIRYTPDEQWNYISIPVSGWNPTYDMFTISLNVPAKTVLGIRLINNALAEAGYLRNHYRADSMIVEGGVHELYYYDVQSFFATGSLVAIEIYFDPPSGVRDSELAEKSVTVNSYDIKRSSLMPSATITASSATVDFDGNPQEITGTSNAAGEMKTFYKKQSEADSAFVETAPVNGGVYTARVTFMGNATYKKTYTDVTLTINRILAPQPPVEALTLDYVTGTIVFTSAYEVSKSTLFDTLEEASAEFEEGASYYYRIKENDNYIVSDARRTLVAPVRSDVTITAQNLVVNYDGNAKTITAQHNAGTELELIYEYKAQTEPDTLYTKTAPVNAGDYNVRITLEGTAQFRTATIVKEIKINKTKAATPVLADLKINFATERIQFDSDKFIVSSDLGFTSGNLYAVNAQITPSATVYVKRIADGNWIESDVATLTIPGKTVAAPVVALDFALERTTVVVPTEWQFKIGTSSWVSGIGDYLNLDPGSDGITVYIRVKATVTSFAGQETVLTVPKRPSKPPAVAMESNTATSVTLVVVPGYEYRCNIDGDGVWQDSNVFEGLEANTDYEFSVRKKATSSTYASEAVSAFLSTGKATTNNKKGCNSSLSDIPGFGGIAVLFTFSLILLAVSKKKTRAK